MGEVEIQKVILAARDMEYVLLDRAQLMSERAGRQALDVSQRLQRRQRSLSEPEGVLGEIEVIGVAEDVPPRRLHRAQFDRASLHLSDLNVCLKSINYGRQVAR